MTDARLLRITLETIDDLVDRLVRRAVPGTAVAGSGTQPRLVIDEGRAAAEWAIDVEVGGAVERIGLVVVCDLVDGQLTDARVYVAPPRRNPTPIERQHEGR